MSLLAKLKAIRAELQQSLFEPIPTVKTPLGIADRLPITNLEQILY